MKTTDRVLSFLLALVMVFSLLPSHLAYAEAPEDEGIIAPVEDPDDPAGDLVCDVLDDPAHPNADPAGEGETAPAFVLQPESGEHPAGGSYLLRWALNRLPDRLELVREEPAWADAPGGPLLDENGEPETVLVLEEELEAASTALEMTAPEEETVWRLRAFFDGEALISDAFTVTLLPEEEPVILSEAKDLPEDSEDASAPAPDAAQPDTEAEEPAAAPVERDAG